MGRWPVPRWWAVGAVSVRLALLVVVSLVVRLMLVALLVFPLVPLLEVEPVA